MKNFPTNIRKYSDFIKTNPIRLITKSWLQQFTPFSRQHKDTDTCVITNGIPKSGTYFINKIIEALGKWENIRIHIIPGEFYTVPVNGDFIYYECLPRFSVKRLLNGQFIAAHLPFTEDLDQVMGNVTFRRRIKHILFYRDPRDTLVSYTRFVTYSPNYYRTQIARAKQDFMRTNYSNDDDRLTHIIKERADNYSVKYDYLAYEPWLHSPNCCAIKFEDIYTEFIGIKENGFGNVLRKLFDYLEIDAGSIDPTSFYNSVYGKSITASDEKNKVAQYKRYFKEQHYNMIDNPEFRKVLDAFDYNW